MYCVWQVVKTSTIILNNPIYIYCILGNKSRSVLYLCVSLFTIYRCSLVSNSNSWITEISDFQNPHLSPKTVLEQASFYADWLLSQITFFWKFSTSFAHTIWNVHKYQYDINIHPNIPIKVTETACMVLKFSSKFTL